MVGYYVRHGHWLSTFNTETLFREIDQRFFDYVVGTLVVAPVLAIAGGLLTAAIAWGVRRATSDSARSRRRVRGRLAVYGSRWGLGFFRLVLRLGGIWPAYLALWFVVPYYLLFRPSLRRSMVPYLSRRFPGEGRLRRFARSARWLMAFSRTLVQQGAVRICGKDYFEVSVRDQAGLLELARSGQGIVLLMSHIGPWMVILHYLRIMKRRVHLMIVREFEGLPVLAVEDPEESKRFSMIDTGKSMGGLIEATSALLKGDMVAIMGDRPWGGRTVKASFLGDDCRVLRTPYKLARATGSRMVMLLAHETGYRKFEILWEDLSEQPVDAQLDEEEIAGKQANAYLSHLEEFLNKEPYLWSDFFDFWNTDERETETEGSVGNGATPVGART
jgi:predicted LPLAT superfamily acyltransferase